MTRFAILALFLTSAFASCGTASVGEAPDPPLPPNIVFIVADDLGYGDLGSYGQELIGTPNLDRMAREGRRYTDFYAGSTVCAPSRCALVTGYHMGRAFIRGNGRQDLRPEDVTVGEVLQAAGYETAVIGKWGLGHEGSDGVPTRQGFDSFYGYLDQRHAHNFYPSFLVRDEKRVALANVVPNEGEYGQGVATEKVQYSHDLLTDEALAFLERPREKPFFLLLTYTIPHANNEAGPKGMEVPDLGPYEGGPWPEPELGFAGMLHRLDADVGRLLDKLGELGIDERTVVFFTSDNGPHGEGGHDPGFFDSNGPLRGRKRDLLEGGIRVPLIARWPGTIDPGTTSDHAAAFWDVLPTLAELAGTPELVPEGSDGVSFAPSLRGQAQVLAGDLYWAFYERGGARALRRHNWKAVQQPIDSAVRLYDLSVDPGEGTDLAAQHPELALELSKAMDAAYEPSTRWRWKSQPGEGR